MRDRLARLLAVVCLAGCGGNSATTDGGGSDSGGGGKDLSVSDGGGGTDGGAMDASVADAAVDGGGISVTLTGMVSLGAKPRSLALNKTTLRIYAGLPTGIAVVDASKDMLVTTIPNPGGSPAFSQLAVDETANLIYAANNADGNVYVIDGSNNTFGAMPIAAAPPGGATAGALAVDSAGQRLYVLTTLSMPGVPITKTVVVINTSTKMVVTTVAITDLIGIDLALDTMNKKLFVCGVQQMAPGTVAADTVDTTNNMVSGTQQVFTGYTSSTYDGCQAGPGFAALVTKPQFTGNGPGVVHLLEPIDVKLPAGFVPDKFEYAGKVPSHSGPGQVDGVSVLGHDANTGELEYLDFESTGETNYMVYGPYKLHLSAQQTDILVTDVLVGDATDIWSAFSPGGPGFDMAGSPFDVTQLFHFHTN